MSFRDSLRAFIREEFVGTAFETTREKRIYSSQ